MVREISAGGVVVQRREGAWRMAAIELPPAETGAGEGKKARAKSKSTVCLPKGLVDAGEKPLETALREVREETGVTAIPITKLADIKYVYVRSWGDGQRVFKIVSFYLLRYESGEIDQITEEMRIEVARAFWIPLQEAASRLSYKGEKQMARKALEYLETHAVELESPAG